MDWNPHCCFFYHPLTSAFRLVGVVSYVSLWNALVAVGLCFWPDNQFTRLPLKDPKDIGVSPSNASPLLSHTESLVFDISPCRADGSCIPQVFFGMMFIFSNQTLLLSKLLHDIADHPETHWRDRTPLNGQALLIFLLSHCVPAPPFRISNSQLVC